MRRVREENHNETVLAVLEDGTMIRPGDYDTAARPQEKITHFRLGGLNLGMADGEERLSTTTRLKDRYLVPRRKRKVRLELWDEGQRCLSGNTPVRPWHTTFHPGVHEVSFSFPPVSGEQRVGERRDWHLTDMIVHAIIDRKHVSPLKADAETVVLRTWPNHELVMPSGMKGWFVSWNHDVARARMRITVAGELAARLELLRHLHPANVRKGNKEGRRAEVEEGLYGPGAEEGRGQNTDNWYRRSAGREIVTGDMNQFGDFVRVAPKYTALNVGGRELCQECDNIANYRWQTVHICKDCSNKPEVRSKYGH